jgi:fatty acid desaturase
MSPTTDPRHAPRTTTSALERFLLGFLKDERDLLPAKVIAAITLTLLPGAALLFVVVPGVWVVPLAPLWLLAVYGGFGGRYMLLVHLLCHRPMFRKQWEPLNLYVTGVLGAFFGNTPTSFYVHHIGIHHPENNLEDDVSCTLPYERDRFSHFLHYWARFFFFGYLHLPRYFAIKKRPKLARSLLLGELSWFAAVAVLGLLDPWATLVVLVLPFCLIRWFMMCGNFAQHAFVDVDDPNNAYRNSTCLTNTPYNHKCYNDGYHIVHHLKPNLHWTEMAQWYDDHRDEFARQDAIVFSGIRNNQQVWWLLMTRNYRTLAEHLVDFQGRSLEERITFLQARVRRRRGAVKALAARDPLPALTAG